MEVLRVENSALQPDLKCEGALYITWFWGNLIHLMIIELLLLRFNSFM